MTRTRSLIAILLAVASLTACGTAETELVPVDAATAQLLLQRDREARAHETARDSASEAEANSLAPRLAALAVRGGSTWEEDGKWCVRPERDRTTLTVEEPECFPSLRTALTYAEAYALALKARDTEVLAQQGQ